MILDPPAIASDVPESKFGNMLQVIDPPAIAAFCLVACGLIVIVAQLGQWLGVPL